MRRIVRPREGRVIGGVCAGLGQYFQIDPVLFRLGFVIMGVCYGTGLLAYLIALFVIPSEDTAS
jgi:phage shock protein C